MSYEFLSAVKPKGTLLALHVGISGDLINFRGWRAQEFLTPNVSLRFPLGVH